MKILITDDSAFMRKILSNVLTSLGYTDIIQAQNGEEAIEKFNKEKPDLVLLDIVMDKKDGISTLKDIKTSNPKAKVVMISAVGQEQMVTDAKNLGALDFIVKPFKNDNVAAIVNKILK